MVNRQENKESITIVWFDSNIHLYNHAKNINEQLRQINDYNLYYSEIESCINYIQSIDKEKIFLITSSINASQILSQINTLSQIHFIFIFDFDKEQSNAFIVDDLKFIGLYTKLDNLYLSIQEQIEFDEELFQTFSFFDQHEYLIQDLSKQTSDLLWFKLFNNIILELSHDQSAKNEMINLYRQYYQDNLKNLKLIEKFEHDYCSDNVIQWYFIRELIQNFECQYQNRIHYEKEKSLIVYRGIKLSREQLEKFKEYEGKHISINGFLAATRFRLKALNFARKSVRQTNFIAAILEIECNSEDFNKNIIFTDIDKSNEVSYQDDILFNLNVTFNLNNIELNENIWIIKMNISNEGKTILKKYIEDTRHQIENLNIEIVFARLMLDMGQWDQSQKYFERLLNNRNSTDQAWIEHSLGEIHHLKREFILARKYYNRAYN
ncbi:unnamed protein product [Rotaria sp. Silwood1]|nr:unnamed protein product [Rotaria sp. Silwood1]